MAVGAECVMLDNFSGTQARPAIALREQCPDKRRMKTEISGNVNQAKPKRWNLKGLAQQLNDRFYSCWALT